MSKPIKPKSAPPRLRSKFVSSKTNTKKEIETWVRGNNDSLIPQHDMSRMCGQLTDNVTEERMLKAKLWELGKERYKFISKNDYDKKMFIEKLKRKSGALQNLLKDPDFNRRLSLGTISSGVGSRLGKRKPTPKSAHAASRRETPSIKIESSSTMTNSAAFTSVKSTKKNPSNESVRFQTGSPMTLDPLMRWGYSQTPSMMSSHVPALDLGSKSWARPSTGSKRGGGSAIIRDPRYYRLEHCLEPNYVCKENVDIKTVVDSMEALHVPPKIPSDSRPRRMGIKVQNFMKERGIVF